MREVFIIIKMINLIKNNFKELLSNKFTIKHN